jgi:hypothetical protein
VCIFARHIASTDFFVPIHLDFMIAGDRPLGVRKPVVEPTEDGLSKLRR